MSVLALGFAVAQEVAQAPAPLLPAQIRAGVPEAELPVGAPCRAPGAELEIEGVGRAVYDRIEVDSAAGTAHLSGGVCIEAPGMDLVLRVAEIDLRGMNAAGGAPPRIEAREVQLDVSGWRLRVARLDGPIDALQAEEVFLLAPGAAGAAATVDLEGERATLSQVALNTTHYRITARQAVLDGEVLTLSDARGTSCTCRVPRYHLSGRRVRVRIGGRGGEIDAPVVEVLGVRVPLGETLTLGPEGPDLDVPFLLGPREDLGTVAAYAPRGRDGVRVELGGTTSLTPQPLATLRAEAGGTRVALEADPRGLWLQGRARHPLGGGAWLDAFSDTRLRDGEERRLRGGLRAGIDPETRLPLGTGGALHVQGALRAGAEIAAEPDRSAAGPRLPFRAEARLRLPVTSWARADLRLTGTATAYPGMTPGGRAALDVAPSLRLEGPLGPASGRLVLGAQRRVTAGGGPFAFDDVTARARLRADGRLGAGPLTLQVRAVRRFAPEAPGWEELSGTASAELALGADWTLRPELRAELAGLAGGPDEEEDWLQAGATAEGPLAGHGASFGLQVRTGARDLALRRVRASAATGFLVAVPGGSVVLEPSVSVDVAPLLRGAGGPALHAHGLRVTVNDCCGGWMLGYDHEDGETRLAFGVTLPPLQLDRPPQPSLPTIPPLPSLDPSPDPSPEPGGSGAAPGAPGTALAGASGRAEGREAP